jgi:hypothetical protein
MPNTETEGIQFELMEAGVLLQERDPAGATVAVSMP